MPDVWRQAFILDTELLFFITYFFEMPGELFSITITKIIFRELVMAVIPSVTGGLRPPAEFCIFFLFFKKVDFWYGKHVF